MCDYLKETCIYVRNLENNIFTLIISGKVRATFGCEEYTKHFEDLDYIGKKVFTGDFICDFEAYALENTRIIQISKKTYDLVFNCLPYHGVQEPPKLFLQDKTSKPEQES